MNGLLYVLALLSTLGCGLVAGVFFAFSSFVMPALKRLPAAEGIAAMRSINVLAVTPVFMTALFGTAAACLGLAAWTAVVFDRWTTAPVFAGCALYLVVTIGVTIVCNVPLNHRLAKLHPRDGEAAGYWNEYVARWTAWNHLRTVAALVAAVILTGALQA